MSQDKSLDQHIITFAKTAPQRMHQFTNYSIKWWNIIVYKQPWRTTPSWFTEQLSEASLYATCSFLLEHWNSRLQSWHP